MQLSDRIGRRMKAARPAHLHDCRADRQYGKAAERLNTSQPNISRSISDLEHSLGVRLLDRRRQGVEPTEYVAPYSMVEWPCSTNCVKP